MVRHSKCSSHEHIAPLPRVTRQAPSPITRVQYHLDSSASDFLDFNTSRSRAGFISGNCCSAIGLNSQPAFTSLPLPGFDSKRALSEGDYAMSRRRPYLSAIKQCSVQPDGLFSKGFEFRSDDYGGR